MRAAAVGLLGTGALLLVVAGAPGFQRAPGGYTAPGVTAAAASVGGGGVRSAAGARAGMGARGGRQESAPVDPLAVSRRAAARLGVRVGDVVEISADPSFTRARRARVVAVWEGPEHPADAARQEALVRLPLPALEAVLGREDAVDRIVVRLRGGADPGRVRDDLRATVAGAEVYTAAELAERTSRAFTVIARFHRAIAVVTILAGGIFLVAIVSLKLSEMRRELGALRLAGVGAGTVRQTVLGLAAAVGLAGTAVGLAMGAALTWGINGYYRPLFDTPLLFARLDGRTVAGAAVLAVVLSLAAGAVVAWGLARRHPLDLVGR